MRRAVPAGVAVAGLAMVLAACGGDEAEPEGSAPPAAGGTLVVWADNSANTAKAIEPLCQQWAEANGVTCTVKKFNGGGPLDEALIAGNNSGDVPDVFEAAHDTIGAKVRDGLIAPVDIGAQAANFSAAAVDAVTYDAKTYGVPWAVENVALLTNTDLSPECPTSLDEAVDNAKKLIADGKVTKGLGIALQIGELGDAYHWYPLYSADGGYAFAQNPDGSFNPDDMGIGKEGSIAASERLAQLAKDGVVQATVTYDIARETFASGKSPYFITGPWQIPEQKEALGDKLMVCPVPNWEGSEYKSQPFLGVRTFFQAAKAKNPSLAATFLNDNVMTTAFMDSMYAVDPRPPAWLESYEKAATDPILKGFGDYGQGGIPMPSIPQMGLTFGDWGLAEYKIASGQDPETTIVDAGNAIQKQIDSIG
jgi:arabinogalactan oligomer/maltooligosaccharide transport system substrate-binding protein